MAAVGGEPTFAEAVVNSEVAPIPAVRATAMVPPESTHRGALRRPCRHMRGLGGLPVLEVATLVVLAAESSRAIPFKPVQQLSEEHMPRLNRRRFLQSS